MRRVLTPSHATFSAANRTITFTTTVPASISHILRVVNLTRATVLFDPTAESGLGYLSSATYASPVLTLGVEAEDQADTDKLFIEYDDGLGGGGGGGGGGDASEAKQDVLIGHVDGVEGLLTTIDGDTGSIDGKLPALSSGRVPVDGSGVTQPVSATSLPLPTGAATEAKQPALQSGAVPVGDNGASLTVDGKAYRAAVTITRPSNTTAYAAGDVVGVADSGTPANAGSAIITLSNIGPAGGYVLIQSVRLMIGNSTPPASAFRLHLYTESPTAILDNAAFNLAAGDVGKYVDYIDLPAPQDFGDIAFARDNYSGLEVKLAAASTTLYAILEARSAYTPASGTLYDLRVLSLEASL
jgi:hypothetical protein